MTFNYPHGDDWWLEDKDPQSQYYGRKFHFDFSELNGEKIKDVVETCECPNLLAIVRMFTPLAIRSVAFVCRREWR